MSDTANCDAETKLTQGKRALVRTIAYKLTGRTTPSPHISAMLSVQHRATLRVVEGIATWHITPRNPSENPTALDLWRQLGIESDLTLMASRILRGGTCIPSRNALEVDVPLATEIGGIRHILAYLDILAQDVLNDWAHDALQTELTNYWAKPSIRAQRALRGTDPYPSSPHELDWL